MPISEDGEMDNMERFYLEVPSLERKEEAIAYIKEFQDIKEKYFAWNKENILGEQKQMLYQDFYEEE